MFTVEQIKEIARKLQAQSKKDSQFSLAKALSGTEYVAILQDQENRKLLLSELTEYIKQQIAPDILAALELLKETLLEELKKSEKILYDKIEDAELHLAEKMDNNVIHFNDRLDELKALISKQTNEDVELSVVSVTPGSVIYLNGERRSKITVKAADLVVIRVIAEGYQSFNEITCVHKSQHIEIELDKVTGSVVPPGPVEYVTLTINPTPSNATVTLNGQSTKSITVEQGTVVSVVVSAAGYKTYTQNITVTSDRTLEVVLQEEVPVPTMCTLTVNANPSNATVTINGQQRKSITVEQGTQVHVQVSASGYQSYDDYITVNKVNQILSVTLEPEVVVEQYTLTVNPTPADAIVKLNNQVRNSITVEQGTRVSISVSKTGYKAHTESIIVNEDIVKNITLTALKTCVLTVTATPSNAVIKINNRTTSTYTGYEGEEVTVQVSASGYRSVSRRVTLSEENQTLHIALEELEGFLFKITVISPAEATLEVNGTKRTSPYEIECTDGDYITWEVSAEGYITQSNRFYIHEDVELEITLEPEPEPTAYIEARCLEGEQQIEGMAYVGFNNESPDSVYDSISLTASETALLYGVPGEGYKFVAWQDTANPSLVLTDNPLTVTAVNDEGVLVDKEYVILVQKVSTYDITFNITPEGATLILDDEEQDYSEPIKLQSGTTHTWSISKEGYTTQSGEFTVTKSETITVVLEPIEPVTEVSWSDLTLSPDPDSENPAIAVPRSGGKISFKATVTAHLSNGSTTIKDVTSQAEWSTSGNGCTSDGGGVFTWSENPTSSKRTSSIMAKVTGPDSAELTKSAHTIQLGGNDTLDIVPNTLTFEAAGGTDEVQIYSNTSWVLEVDDEPDEPNETLEINPSTLNFESEGGTKEVQITSNTNWEFK